MNNKNIINLIFEKKYIKVCSIALMLLIIAYSSFLYGAYRVKVRCYIQLANDGLFHSLNALHGMADLERQKQYKLLFDRGLDSATLMLANMAIKYPRNIRRSEYNLLVQTRAYRKVAGRMSERKREKERELGLDFDRVDEQLARAITIIESLHDTNIWGLGASSPSAAKGLTYDDFKPRVSP